LFFCKLRGLLDDLQPHLFSQLSEFGLHGFFR
jgi:hypothetical protein